MSKRKKLDHTYTDTWITRHESLAGSGFKSYEEYLQSNVWKSIRARASLREHFQECYLCRSREGIELHHTSYKWICAGRENEMRNLRAMCRKHHQEIHALARVSDISVRQATTVIIKRWMKDGHPLAWQVREMSAT